MEDEVASPVELDVMGHVLVEKDELVVADVLDVLEVPVSRLSTQTTRIPLARSAS
jgi:hypothetical protein